MTYIISNYFRKLLISRIATKNTQKIYCLFSVLIFFKIILLLKIVQRMNLTKVYHLAIFSLKFAFGARICQIFIKYVIYDSIEN